MKPKLTTAAQWGRTKCDWLSDNFLKAIQADALAFAARLIQTRDPDNALIALAAHHVKLSHNNPMPIQPFPVTRKKRKAT